MKKVFVIGIIIIVLFGIFSTFVLIEDQEDSYFKRPQLDKHGCDLMQGHLWCGSKSSCFKIWEENCDWSISECKDLSGELLSQEVCEQKGLNIGLILSDPSNVCCITL